MPVICGVGHKYVSVMDTAAVACCDHVPLMVLFSAHFITVFMIRAFMGGTGGVLAFFEGSTLVGWAAPLVLDHDHGSDRDHVLDHGLGLDHIQGRERWATTLAMDHRALATTLTE